jgi:hypothetical protein
MPFLRELKPESAAILDDHEHASTLAHAADVSSEIRNREPVTLAGAQGPHERVSRQLRVV